MLTSSRPEDHHVDRLTGLYNLAYIEQALPAVLKKREARKRPLSLLLFEIDGFDAIKDVLGGRAVGDVVVKIADIIRSSVKSTDAVARCSDREFMVVLENVGHDVASKVAERVVGRVASVSVEVLGKTLDLAVSQGVATFPTHGTDLVTLVKYAFARLRQGRHFSGRRP